MISSKNFAENSVTYYLRGLRSVSCQFRALFCSQTSESQNNSTTLFNDDHTVQMFHSQVKCNKLVDKTINITTTSANTSKLKRNQISKKLGFIFADGSGNINRS